jgi:hypothetical protein
MDSGNISEEVQSAKARAMSQFPRGSQGETNATIPFSAPDSDAVLHRTFKMGEFRRTFAGEIVGHGIGAQTASGSPVIKIYARGMTSEKMFRRAHSIPDAIDGLETRIVHTSGLKALTSPARKRTRPICPGISIAHRDVTAGTLGCFVEDEHGTVFILSNNHVLANVNAGSPGDPILQPSPKDGGIKNDKIGELARFETLDFSGPNAMDAAVARILDDGGINRTILSIGTVVPPAQPVEIDQQVRKYGRTTGDTTGLVDDVSADVSVLMSPGGDALFTEQISIRSENGGPSPSPVIPAHSS